jgi:Oxysterol-binding protein
VNALNVCWHTERTVQQTIAGRVAKRPWEPAAASLSSAKRLYLIGPAERRDHRPTGGSGCRRQSRRRRASASGPSSRRSSARTSPRCLFAHFVALVHTFTLLHLTTVERLQCCRVRLRHVAEMPRARADTHPAHKRAVRVQVCLPVYFNEPLSALQKMAEELEYSELVDKVRLQERAHYTHFSCMPQ